MKKKIKKHTPVEAILAIAKDCKKDGHCCRYSSGTVLKDEVKHLAKFFKIPEKQFIKKYLVPQEKFNTKHYRFKQVRKGKPYGKCVFLKKQENLLACSTLKVRSKKFKISSKKQNPTSHMYIMSFH